ncbi:MAG: L,D-transpeptidase [Rhodoplanes sp.]
MALQSTLRLQGDQDDACVPRRRRPEQSARDGLDRHQQAELRHGTPVPEEVGTTDSHGCVRLTNWDAQALAAMVRRGTKVEFVE